MPWGWGGVNCSPKNQMVQTCGPGEIGELGHWADAGGRAVWTWGLGGGAGERHGGGWGWAWGLGV